MSDNWFARKMAERQGQPAPGAAPARPPTMHPQQFQQPPVRPATTPGLPPTTGTEVAPLDNISAMKDPQALVAHNAAVLNQGAYSGDLPSKAAGARDAQECPECSGTNYFAPVASGEGGGALSRFGPSVRRCMDCGYPFTQRGSGMIIQEPTKGTVASIQPPSNEGKLNEIVGKVSSV